MVKKFFNYGSDPSFSRGKLASNSGSSSLIPDNFLAKIGQRERSEEKSKKFSKGKHLGNRVI